MQDNVKLLKYPTYLEAATTTKPSETSGYCKDCGHHHRITRSERTLEGRFVFANSKGFNHEREQEEPIHFLIDWVVQGQHSETIGQHFNLKVAQCALRLYVIGSLLDLKQISEPARYKLQHTNLTNAELHHFCYQLHHLLIEFIKQCLTLKYKLKYVALKVELQLTFFQT